MEDNEIKAYQDLNINPFLVLDQMLRV